jgi:hypothetical protein
MKATAVLRRRRVRRVRLDLEHLPSSGPCPSYVRRRPDALHVGHQTPGMLGARGAVPGQLEGLVLAVAGEVAVSDGAGLVGASPPLRPVG